MSKYLAFPDIVFKDRALLIGARKEYWAGTFDETKTVQVVTRDGKELIAPRAGAEHEDVREDGPVGPDQALQVQGGEAVGLDPLCEDAPLVQAALETGWKSGRLQVAQEAVELALLEQQCACGF